MGKNQILVIPQSSGGGGGSFDPNVDQIGTIVPLDTPIVSNMSVNDAFDAAQGQIDAKVELSDAASNAETVNGIDSYTINCVGDSLTWGYLGTVGGGYPAFLTSTYGRNTINNGIVGQTSTQIASRFLADSSKFGLSTIFYVGTNNISQQAIIEADIASMVAALGHNRYIVIGIAIGAGQGNPGGVPTTAYTQITGINTALSATYGVRFFNPNTYFATQGDGSPQDNQDIADGIIPTSKRADAIHYNTTGYGLLAGRISSTYMTYLTDVVDKFINVSDISQATYERVGAFTSLQTSGGGHLPTLGSELVTNGTFPSLTGWTNGGNWSAVSNTALHTPGSTATLTQSLTLEALSQYIVTVTISGRTAGSVALTLGALQGSYNIALNGAYTYSFFSPAGGATTLTFTPTSTFDGALSIVSAKAIVGLVRANNVFANSQLDQDSPLEFRTSGTALRNIFMGVTAGQAAYTGIYNLSVGWGAHSKLATGSRNIAFNTSQTNLAGGDDNISIGYNALITAYYVNRVIAIGSNAALGNTGADILAIGYNALLNNTSGAQSTIVGNGSAGSGNTTGGGHTGIGYNVGIGASQSNNSIGGINAFNKTATGTGQNSVWGGTSFTSVTTGSRNSGLGYSVGNNVTTANFSVAIGAWCDLPSNTLSGQLNIGNVIYGLNLYSTNSSSSTPTVAGSIGIGLTTPTARLHLAAGTATAGSAPLKLTAGTNLTTVENGAFEFDGTNLYFSVGGVRRTVTLV